METKWLTDVLMGAAIACITQACSSDDPLAAPPGASNPDAGSTGSDGGDRADSGSVMCGATKASVRFGTAEATFIPSDELWGITTLGSDLFFVGQLREIPPNGPNPADRIHFGRLDAALQPVWTKTFGDQKQVAPAFAADSAGGMIVVGSFTGLLNLGGNDLLGQSSNISAPTAFVARYDRSDGTHRFSVPMGGDAAVEATATATDGAGNVWVAGTFSGTASFGATSLTSQGPRDVFVARLDMSGNVLAAFRRGGDGDDMIGPLAVDPTSGDLVFGEVAGTAPFMTKVSPTGEERWKKPIIVRALTLDAAGDVYVAGSIDRRPILWRFDAGGNEKWRVGSTSNTSSVTATGASAIAIGPDGAVLAGGELVPGTQIDFGGGALSAAEPGGNFVVELGGDGTHRCSRVFTTKEGPPPPEGSLGVAGASLRGVAYTSPTSYVAAGSFGGVLDVGKGPMTSAGGTDIWFAAFDR